MAIPIIDDRIRHVGVSALRGLNAKTLRELKDVLVLQVDEQPVAVLIPWDIYMEIQKALWPSSLLPSLEEVFGPAQAEDVRAADLTDASPRRDAVDEMHETPSPFLDRVVTSSETPSTPPYTTALYTNEDRKALGCTCNPGTADPNCPLENHRGRVVTYPVPLRKGSVVEQVKKEGFRRDIELTALGTDMTPRGGQFSRVDDSQPPVFDDLDDMSDVDAQNELNAKEMVCKHCGSQSLSRLCSACFMAGHREGNCLVCVEKSESAE